MINDKFHIKNHKQAIMLQISKISKIMKITLNI